MDSLGRTAPNTTAPRWEWRAFDVTADQADRLVAPDAPAEETEETYLIGGLRGNAKLRGGLLDVKVLRDVDAAGLERWEPILKAGFPVSGNDVARAFDALEVPTTASSEGTFTASTLLEAASRAGIRALVVRKRRRRATVGGCMAEVVDLRIDDRPTISVAIESEDAEAVERVVRTSGWDPRSNTSYPRGLAALATRPRRVAVIDVGTNSVKFHVAEASPEGWRTIVDRAEVTRLGGGMGGSGRIADDALARTAAAIADMASEAERIGAGVTAVGTAALRRAANRDEVLARIRDTAGVEIDVISGSEEGRLAFLGVRGGLPAGAGSLVVFDTGGGSTEFSFGDDERIDERVSVDVGAGTVTAHAGLDRAVDEAAVARAVAAIERDLELLTAHASPDTLVGVGGSVTNLVAVAMSMAEYDPEAVQGTELRRDEVKRQIARYRAMDVDERRTIVGLQPDRAEVILGGACIVLAIMTLLDRGSLTVSDRGLRHGLVADRFGSGIVAD